MKHKIIYGFKFIIIMYYPQLQEKIFFNNEKYCLSEVLCALGKC